MKTQDYSTDDIEQSSNFQNVQNHIKSQTTYSKCAKTSSEYRDKGNDAYASRNNQLALSFYNQAIRYAPFYSRELSLALGNRSATFYNLKYYQVAMQQSV